MVPELPGSGTLTFVLTRCTDASCAAPFELQVTQEVVHIIQLAASKVSPSQLACCLQHVDTLILCPEPCWDLTCLAAPTINMQKQVLK